MVVLKKSPFPSETLARYIFKVFASRAASELMRYDSELRSLESENQYRELIESSKNPIYIIIGHNYALVNSAWLNMFEYTLEEVQSPEFSMQNIVEPESRDVVRRRLDNFLAGINQPFQYELKAVSKSGKKYDLDVSVTHLNWQGKRAAQGVYRNVTGAKKKEKQLHKALKLSHEDAQMKTAFLANISQEAQTTLNNINHKAQDLLNSKSVDPQVINFAEYIVSNSSKLLENVNDILDISNIEMGKMSLNVEKFIISELLKDIVQYFIPSASKKGVKIVCCKKRYNSAVVEADPIRVRQILINLMSNAVQYTDKGEIRVNYTIRQDDVKISIADTGVGIEPEKLKSIYKSFIDPNGKFPIEYDGSGLGLTVTRSLIQLMNGKIWVEPNPEGGSIFNFTIPLA
jgi:PAS domain S-box-containing protein